MYGICGTYNYVRSEPVDEHLLRRMTRLMEHRVFEIWHQQFITRSPVERSKSL